MKNVHIVFYIEFDVRPRRPVLALPVLESEKLSKKTPCAKEERSGGFSPSS